MGYTSWIPMSNSDTKSCTMLSSRSDLVAVAGTFPRAAMSDYRLTTAGRKQLVSEQSKWKLLVKTIARVMRPA